MENLGLQSIKSEYKYAEISLELLLKIIPLNVFAKTENRQVSNNSGPQESTIIDTLLTTKSSFM